MDAFTRAFNSSPIPARIAALKAQNKRYSDVEDASGNQYVDLVQEGGGVLGIALTGYTHVLEQAGIRFFSLAGTSAGAINTMMLAALGPVAAPKSEAILRMLSSQPLFDLVDGNAGVRKLIRKFNNKENGIGWTIAFNAMSIYRTLRDKLGLNPGDVFTQWITREMAATGIHTLADLTAMRNQLPDGFRHTGGRDISSSVAQIVIITSDITTHTKVEFPRMASLYWAEADKVNPAAFVRASMSIPIFFEPFKVTNVPDAGSRMVQRWCDNAGYNGTVPDTVRFVDGGMLSNFPINVFHRKDGQVPSRPTFGVRLSTWREGFSKTDNMLQMSGAMVSTMRQIHDYDFLLKNPDYSYLICMINADDEFNWLNFDMDEDEQVRLFMKGCNKAIEFLETFNWEHYKGQREGIGNVEALGYKKDKVES